MHIANQVLFTHVALKSSNLDWPMALAFFALASEILFKLTRQKFNQNFNKSGFLIGGVASRECANDIIV